MTFTPKNKKIYIAGHRGMVGNALVRRLKNEECKTLTALHSDLDLTDQAATYAWFNEHKPDAAIIAAAKVGGIHANATYPADFITSNGLIALNTIEAARRSGVKKLIFLGSACIYPKITEQPIKEFALLSSALEPSNQWYAIAKILGTKMCEAYRQQYGLDFISLQPANLFGVGDNFDPVNGHVIPSMIRKFHDAKVKSEDEVLLWGTGSPRREFLYVDDLADAIIFALTHYSEDETLNVGSGNDCSIKELAETISNIVGFEGHIKYDTSKPDGTPRRMVDSSKLIKLGWQQSTNFEDGLRTTYAWFQENIA